MKKLKHLLHMKMSHPHEDEISEIIEYITGMRRTFNRKLDDHLFIMEQQNHRIEEQYRVIDEQRVVIDELAWQIRDLRDSVRQVSEQKSNCVCNYENHVSRHRNKENDTTRRDFRIEQIGKLNIFFKNILLLVANESVCEFQ